MPPRILALAPQGIEGIRVVAAACRSSALGVLDYGMGAPLDSRPFEGLGKLTHATYGMRISVTGLLKSRDLWWEATDLVILCTPVGSASGEAAGFEAAIKAADESGRLVVAEVTSRAEMRHAI